MVLYKIKKYSKIKNIQEKVLVLGHAMRCALLTFTYLVCIICDTWPVPVAP